MPNDAALAEHRSVRAEIEQLNGQLFTVLSTALTLDITILGSFFTREDPSKYFVIRTIGIILLFFGSVLLLTRNRLAHRVAFFQKYFIEPRTTGRPARCCAPGPPESERDVRLSGALRG